MAVHTIKMSQLNPNAPAPGARGRTWFDRMYSQICYSSIPMFGRCLVVTPLVNLFLLTIYYQFY